MTGVWFRQVEGGSRFVIKIAPGESVPERLAEVVREAGIRHAIVVSAIGSIRDVRFRGIMTGARLPLTPARMHEHEVEGPLELLALAGNILPDEHGRVDCHLHVMAARSSGQVLGGHLRDARVFATCEIVLTELVGEGLTRDVSRSGGTRVLRVEPS